MDFSKALLLLTGFAELGNAYDAQLSLSTHHNCSNPGLSCPAHLPSPVDSCCLNTPSGHFLLTQFWDAQPALGPSDAWTTHGLWPDLCSGGFDQFCDSSRAYSNISAILKETSPNSDLLDFMQKRWLSLNGDNNHLWAHEWNKHGTCISTLEPDCYSEESNAFDDVLDYFNHAASLYSALDTYQTLAEHDIEPSRHRTYTLSELEAAIAPSHDNQVVTFRCHGHTLSEIRYHFTVRGSLRKAPAFNASISPATTRQATRQIFIPTAPDGAKTNCPSHGIRYLPKAHASPQPTSTPSTSSPSHPSPTSTSTPAPFSGRGHLLVRITNSSSSSLSSSPYTGCLIRTGQWYLTTRSSCATYIAQEDVQHLVHLVPQIPHIPTSNLPPHQSTKQDHLFTLSSLSSPCAVIPISNTTPDASAGQFTCAKNLGIQSIFGYSSVSSSDSDSNSNSNSDTDTDTVTERAVLSHLGKTTFYASKTPSKFERVDIYVTDGDGDGGTARKVEIEIEWQAL